MFDLFRRNNFHDGLSRDIRITSDAFRSALKRDYINTKYLNFANPKLQEIISEEITSSWFLFLNLDANALVEQLEKLVWIFVIKWLVTTGKVYELEALLEKDKENNPLMHYGDDVIESFSDRHFREIQSFVAKEWSPYFRRIVRNITSQYSSRMLKNRWQFWAWKEDFRYMKMVVSRAELNWRISSFQEKFGQWQPDDGYFTRELQNKKYQKY